MLIKDAHWKKKECLKIMKNIAYIDILTKYKYLYWLNFARKQDKINALRHKIFRLNYKIENDCDYVRNCNRRNEAKDELHFLEENIKEKCINCDYMIKNGFCIQKTFDKCYGGQIYEILKLNGDTLTSAVFLGFSRKEIREIINQ